MHRKGLLGEPLRAGEVQVVMGRWGLKSLIAVSARRFARTLSAREGRVPGVAEAAAAG